MAPAPRTPALVAIVCVTSLAGPALAESHSPAATQPVPLRYDTAESLFVIGSTAYVAALFQFSVNAQVTRTCRFCEPPAFDRAVRRALVTENTSTVHVMSDVAAFGLAPVSAFGTLTWVAGHDERGDEALVNALLVTEAASTTLAVTQVTKAGVARERPAVHFGQHGPERYSAAERNASFFSGHSSLTFSLAVSSGTVATMRGYRAAPLVWGVGLPIATFTAYARIAGDAHYFSDVLVGSLVGSGIGFALPWFAHPRVREKEGIAWQPRLIPLQGGMGVGMAGSM